MAVHPEGTPCWADATFADLEGAKSFYGDVLGWTFGDSAAEFGNYTQAYADGRAVAAVSPPMPGADDQPAAWCLYIAAQDAGAAAQKVRDNGGEVVVEPMRVSDFGTMVLARDPSGVAFGIWQSGTHEGFEATAVPGAYCWAEVFTREPGKSDAFFPAVFPYTVRKMDDDAVDFSMFLVGDDTVLGRMAMGDEFPPEVPPCVNVYFTVEDCDATVAKATERGGTLRLGPMDSPFGRFASLSDPQGATFSVLDPSTTKGDMPQTSAVS